MFDRHLLAIAVVLFAIVSSASAAPAKQVLRLDPSAANLLAAPQPYEGGFQRDGDVFNCANADATSARGVAYHVTLNQTQPYPLIATAWSKADNVTGGSNPDYALYLDLTYTDGTHLWGQSASFDVGTHDWQQRRIRIVPEKPIKQVYFYLLFRRHGGRVSFREPSLVQLTPPQGATLFDGTPVLLSGGRTGFAIRDVAANSDFVMVENNQALGLELDVQTTTQPTPQATFHHVRLTNPTDTDRVVTLLYTLQLPGKGYRWLADPRRDEPADSPRDYRTLANPRLSRYPLAAVSKDGVGQAILLDLAHPAVFRVGYNAAFSELYIAYDLALVPEKSAVELRFCTVSFDATWGFRAAVAAMYDLFPDYFRCRIPTQGIWMPFHAISKVENPADFGFKFKEGDGEAAWDDANAIFTFRYTEPLTWWMPMPKELPRTLEAAFAHAQHLASQNNPHARALLASGYHDERGRPTAQLLDTPWCNGAVWSMNSAPAIASPITDFKNKWNSQLRAKLYPSAQALAHGGPHAGLDGEYIDSSEGYVTAEFNFRREHFAAMRTPLTFASDSHRPAIYRGLIAYEYARGLADDVHAMGKLMMANSTPDQLCWLAPLLDVMGTETDWNPNKRWQPMSDANLLYRRVLCGPKPYCFLMNTPFDDFPYELTEKYFKRCLAYGMFPSFFSHNAADGHYFSRPDLYNRDRALFKKYIPLCQRVAEAGWQPVPLARVSDARLQIERFGRKYLTLFNDSPEPVTATLTLDGVAPAGEKDLVHAHPIIWTGSTARLTVAPEDVMIVEVR